MSKNKVYFYLVVIFILAFGAGNLVYPGYFNRLADYINLPRFPEIPFKLGLDLQGGAHLVYQADLTGISQEDRASAMEGLRDVIERRVDIFGVREPVIQVQGERLIIELAGVMDVDEAIKMIGQTPFLEFKEQRSSEETQKIIDKRKEAEEFIGKEMEQWTAEDFQKIQEIPEWHLIFEDAYFVSTPLTGRYLKRAEIGFDQTTFQPLVSLEFDKQGGIIFEELTGRNINKLIAIYIDRVLISTPVVQEKISGGQAQISGQFTVEEARELARNLNAGALPVPIQIISQQRVGPILGKVSLEQSFQAGIFGFLAVIIFMIIFYRLPGFLASLALVIYIILILSLFKLIPVTLTLAGMAGFLLSVGMAVDANILIFSRLKEELKAKKNLSQSIEEGFSRAWSSIRDGNLTTLLVTIILFYFGLGFVRGFALALGLGILVSMFSAIFITKNFLKLFEQTSLEKINWLWR
ncbi:MAG: protein translocase subunit SecD [Candidatus Nealsonbacteria bacterium]|nr:protein translocase subunit SecD [Candidatus Nealsonbacteria bacterium]